MTKHVNLEIELDNGKVVRRKGLVIEERRGVTHVQYSLAGKVKSAFLNSYGWYSGMDREIVSLIK